MDGPVQDEGAAAGAEAGGATPLQTRWFELGVALLLLAVSVAVVADSLRVGARWGDDGPQPGYFPFYVGLILGASSVWTLVQQLRRWRADRGEVFLTRPQARDVFSVLWPMALHVAAIPLLGIYLASALLIAWFMLRHGRHARWVTAAVSLGVPLVFFLVFERWFVVPLPKGPVEAWLGF
jgi:hypothetical protein